MWLFTSFASKLSTIKLQRRKGIGAIATALIVLFFIFLAATLYPPLKQTIEDILHAIFH